MVFKVFKHTPLAAYGSKSNKNHKKNNKNGRVMLLAQYEWCIWSGWAVALAARVKNRSAPGSAMFLR